MFYHTTVKLSLLSLLALASFTMLLAQTRVTFQVSDIPEELLRSSVGIRGDHAPLSWGKSVKMERREGRYEIILDFPPGTKTIEFKFVLFDKDKNPSWEGTENRSLHLVGKQNLSYDAQWDEPPFIDPKTLPMLQPKALQQDYALIEAMLLKVHPGLYRYNDEVDIQKALGELKQAFSQPITHGQAYLAISKLLASIQCGHTFASFYNQNGLLKSVIHRQVDKLPFTFRWVEERMFVQYNASQEEILERGTEILEINGQDPQEILGALVPYVSADGAGRASRVAHLEVHGYDFRYDAFDVFYPLAFPLEKPEWNLIVKKLGAKSSRKLTVSATTRKERHKKLVQRFPDFPKDRNAMLSYRVEPGGVGVLKLGSFGLMGWKRITRNYKAFYQEAFEAFAKNGVDHLVIDIRDNVGGNDEMKNEFATYFNIDRFIDKSREGRTRYLLFPEALKPYVQSWGDPWYFDFSQDRPEKREGYYLFPRSHWVNQKNKRKPDVFKGKVYLLTSARNSSLAYYLAKDFKTFKVGTSVGQETDGNLRGINGGQILFLRLPQSDIEIDFPIMGDFSLTPQPNQGVIPDIMVKPKIADIQQGVDTEMVQLMQLIQQSKSTDKEDY